MSYEMPNEQTTKFDPKANLEMAKFLLDSDLVHHVIVTGETGTTVLATKDKVLEFDHEAHRELAPLAGSAEPTSSPDEVKEIK